VQRSTQIEHLVSAWFDGASTGSDSLIGRHVSRHPGVRLIGSDPTEWLSGGEEIATFLRGEVLGAGGKVSFAPSDTEAYEEGSVGWVSTHLTITMPDGATVSPRWSAVLHREDGEWCFVQTHASFGVGNEAAGWQYPA
jgi:hypothetical protein